MEIDAAEGHINEAVFSYFMQNTEDELNLQQHRCENVSPYHRCPCVYRLLSDTESKSGYIHIESSDEGLEVNKK
jgi:hypothetical protein